MVRLSSACRYGMIHTVLFVLYSGSILFMVPCIFGQEQPNIIFILTDDQGIDAVQGANWPNDLQCYTPVIATLSSRGRVFGNTRVNPVCSPSRATLMTGRSALRTGVTTTYKAGQSNLGLLSYERTIAEVLHDLGYFTLLMDKWHLSGAPDQDPESQGFDIFRNARAYMYLDDPIAVGDEHISLMVNLAIRDVLNRPDPTKPYALFFWSIDPHRRTDTSGRELHDWWKVDESLLPSGERYYNPNPQDDTNRDRYRAVVEASDTEYGRLLQSLGVVDSQLRYIPSSNTVVFFLSDNGTPDKASLDPNRAKGTLFDGGIRVPFFVFGENVPDDGAILDRLISGQDMYDTIADIVGASPDIRDRKELPRRSFSFADDIGWSSVQLPHRQFVISFRVTQQDTGATVALTGAQYKLICDASSKGLDDINNDILFDILNDPGETTNLLTRPISRKLKNVYSNMRNEIVDYWNISVSIPLTDSVDILTTAVGSLNSLDRQLDPPAIGYINPGDDNEVEARYFITFDVDSIDNLLPDGYTMADVVSAEIILFLRSDADAPNETATAPLNAFMMNTNWHRKTKKWADLYNRHGSTPLGVVELMPHIARDQDGLNIPVGTPMSMGHSTSLLQVINDWHDGIADNYGVVILADPLPTLGGNQQIYCIKKAALRLHWE